MFTFKAKFSQSIHGPTPEGISTKVWEEKAWISWGDHCWWHIEMIRNSIIARYGKESVSKMRQGPGGYLCFDHVEEVDFELIGKDLGVRHSSPSSSST